MSPKTETKKPAKKSGDGFTDAEKAAMKARAQEVKAEARVSKNREEGEKAVAAAIKQMKGLDLTLASRVHELVTAAAPALMPKTWYGMPAYANSEGKIICFFQAAGKFGVRYATLGFQPDALLDEGNMWPTSFALIQLTPAEESAVSALVKRAAR